MNYNEESLDNIKLIGISVITSNENGKSQSDIVKLWKQFSENDIANKISNKLSEDIYCVYTDYESDHTGKYKAFIGYPTAPIATIITEGLESLEIKADKYYKFVSEGIISESVKQTWQHIWSMNYPRAYHADFDIYKKQMQNSNSLTVTTYISIK